MALVYHERIRENSETTGLGNIILSGVPDGTYQTFASRLASLDTCDVAIFGSNSFECCRAVFNLEGNDTFTKVLLHMDGADASTSFPDSNAGGAVHTWTANGNAQVDTAQSEFGGASGLFDGTGDFLSTPDSANFTVGSGDFTAECWFDCNVAAGTSRFLFGQADSSATSASWSISANRNASPAVMRVDARVGVTTFAVTGTTVFTNSVNTGWHHLAFVRTGNILRMFIDGVQEGGDVAITGSINDSSNNLAVGRLGELSGQEWLGWIDEFRLSVGIARWTANFTPPTVAYGTLPSLTRGAVYASSNADGHVNFSAGNKIVILTLPANRGREIEVIDRQGTAVVSAATTNIWDTTADSLHVTGSTGITSFGTAPRAGLKRWLIFDGNVVITRNASTLETPSTGNLRVIAGDRVLVYADTTTRAVVLAHIPLGTFGGDLQEIAGAAASTVNIWITSGSSLHITGTTGITSFGTAARPGLFRWLLFDASLTITRNASTLETPFGANITTIPGDVALVYADSTTKATIVYYGRASAATTFTDIKQAATTSATGVVELATDAEAIAKTDTVRALTASNLAALTVTDAISVLIGSPQNKDYPLNIRLPWAATLTRMAIKTASGTCTATLKIGGVVVGNGSFGASSSIATSSLVAPNTASATNVVTLTVSAVSSAVDLSVVVEFTRGAFT